MIIESYQEQRELEKDVPTGANFATIGTVYEDGVTLIFEQGGKESVKHYSVNRSIVFRPGDLVKLFYASGTYVAEYPIGKPITELHADTATTATTAETAQKADSADVAMGLKSNDDANDSIRLTYNPSKRVFAALSSKYTSTWTDLATK